MNNVIYDCLKYIDENDQEAVAGILADCAIFIESGDCDDILINNFLKKIIDVYDDYETPIKSSMLWVIGKTNEAKYSESLRVLFDSSLNSHEPELIRQWLISYENLVGNSVENVDLYRFTKILNIFKNNERVAKVLKRLNFSG